MKKANLILFLLLIPCIIRADFFEKLPYTVKQPDGQVIRCYISGDEYYARIHDVRDFTIVQAPDGFYYYALKDGELIRPSPFKAGSVDPMKEGLKKGARISAPEYHSRHARMNNVRTLRNGAVESAPVTGILNNLVIYIRFADDQEFSRPRQQFLGSFNTETGLSLNSYFREVSYNKLNIISTHYPGCDINTNVSYKDYRNRNFFEPFNATTNPEGYRNADEKGLREHSLLADAVTWVNQFSPVSAGMNIDANSDGFVDNICFIIRGGKGTWNELIWAHKWTLYNKDAYINGKRVYSYIFLPEDQLSVRTICHEMFHVFGAPDLYHFDDPGINPVGCWDIMERGSGHMTAYMKWKYSGSKWIKEIPEITSSGTYRMNPLTSPDQNCYKIKSNTTETQYFTIEYRKKSGIFESSLPGSGLIVTRIDPTIKGNSSGPPDEIYVFRPGGTTTADGEYAEAFLCSTAGRPEINDVTNPGSFLQDGTPGGLHISDIREENGQIVFRVVLGDENEPSGADIPGNIITSTPQIREQLFRVYPNPASDHINISLEDNQEPVTIEIRDIRGSLIYSKKNNEDQSGNVINIDITDKTPGMYIIEIRNKKIRRSVNVIKL